MEVVNWVTKQAGKLADNFNNYKFYVKATPESIDSSTILALTAFTSREEQALVPCEFRWFRVKNGIRNEALQFKGNTFMCQPSDVGCLLQAQVTSLDVQHNGTALLKYGPVQLDILLKQTIQSSLSVGTAKFNIQLIHNDISKQCVFTISDQYIRIQQVNSQTNIRFAYNINEPLINAIPKDPTKIIIIFSQKFQSQISKFIKDLMGNVSLSSEQKIRHEMKLLIKFLNRRQKDEFLFILKGYNAKKQLKYSIIINKVQKLQINSDNINYMFTIQSLQNDLRRMHVIYKNHQQQKNIYRQQTLRLQQQIQQIISSYTKLIQGKFKNRQEFQQSFVQFQNKKDKTIAHKYSKIQEENMRLKQFIRQNVDKEFKNIQINYKNTSKLLSTNQYHGIERPFGKKTRPFDQLNLNEKKDSYQPMLTNIDEQNYNIQIQHPHHQLQKQNQYLNNQLNNSLHKIQKLQNQLQRYEKANKSAYIDNEMNRSTNKLNTSAISISTSKVIDEKLYIQKKYQKLKEDYKNLKIAFNQKDKGINGGNKNNKEESLLLQNHYQNPQFNQEANKEISRLKDIILNLQKEKENYKLKAQFLSLQIKKTKDEYEKLKMKHEKTVCQLNEEVEMARRNHDVLNRSQHMNMQMDDYNMKQNEILKQQLAFLQGQNERIQVMCQKYKSQYKRLKQLCKANSP